jgi:hypothetical protein
MLRLDIQACDRLEKDACRKAGANSWVRTSLARLCVSRLHQSVLELSPGLVNTKLAGRRLRSRGTGAAEPPYSTQCTDPQIPSVTNAIEISDMRKGTGGWVTKATVK